MTSPTAPPGLFAQTCRQIHTMNPGTGVELLIDDIKGNGEALEQVFDAQPEVFAHNLETVPRIFKQIRPAFRYERSLDVITMGKDAGMITKSNLILGMGETTDEIIESMQRLHDAGCDILTITQYLRPSKLHHPIDRWVKPEEFLELLPHRRGDGIPRGHGGTDGALLVPRRKAVGAVHEEARPRDPRESPPPRPEPASTSGSRERRRPPQSGRRELTPARPREDPSNMARKSESKPAKGDKKSDGPKKPGRLKQMLEVFKYTQEVDRTTLPWMIGAVVIAIILGVLLSWLVLNSPWYGIFLGIAVGLLAAMLILARKAERAAFSRIKGQSGAPLAAMQSIRRGWDVAEEPVQVDPRSQKMLFRASGRAGIAVVAEDSSAVSMKLLEKERRNIRRVLQHENVPIHQIVVGDGEGEVPLHKLPSLHDPDEARAHQGRVGSGEPSADRAAPLDPAVRAQGRGPDRRHAPTARRCAAAEPTAPCTKPPDRSHGPFGGFVCEGPPDPCAARVPFPGPGRAESGRYLFDTVVTSS